MAQTCLEKSSNAARWSVHVSGRSHLTLETVDTPQHYNNSGDPMTLAPLSGQNLKFSTMLGLVITTEISVSSTYTWLIVLISKH